jgi:hypothetical protein
MPRAGFEEREYEHPLYQELQAHDRPLWAPGQVLEGRVGFDRALFVGDDFLFDLHGMATPPGISLSRYRAFFHGALRFPPGRSLPNFSLNVFLQAKRPFVCARSPRPVAAHGVHGRCWRMDLDAEQQVILGKLAAKFGGRALVTYATPAFHTERDLYRHTIDGAVVGNSSFPSASRLDGHSAWFYKGPGAAGVAHSESTPIGEPDLFERIDALRSALHSASPSADEDASWRANLARLARDVVDVLHEDGVGSDYRRARFFTIVNEYRALARQFSRLDADWMIDYAKVAALTTTFRMSWLVAV